MGFLDNVRSHFKNNDEEEFERAFRDPSWPVGVDDFEPMTNTGSFLPATFDVDPLADASLPGNAMHGAGTGQPVPFGAPAAPVSTESVVRSAGTAAFGSGVPQPQGGAPVTAQPMTAGDTSVQPPVASSSVSVERQFAVVETPPDAREARVSDAAAPYEPPRLSVIDGGPSGYSQNTPRFDMGDEGVQVYTRQGERVARPTPPIESKPFADRLRERVAAANVAGQVDETLGRSRAATQAAPVKPAPRAADISNADIDAELEERRSRRSQSQSRPAGQDDRHEGAPAQQGADNGPRGTSASSRPASASPAPVPMSCVVVRPRSYDDVRDIIQGLIGEHRPVVMVLKGCSNDLARRILDVSFGLCCASGAAMKEFGDHVYGVVPRGTTFTESDATALQRQGIVLRG